MRVSDGLIEAWLESIEQGPRRTGADPARERERCPEIRRLKARVVALASVEPLAGERQGVDLGVAEAAKT